MKNKLEKQFNQIGMDKLNQWQLDGKLTKKCFVSFKINIKSNYFHY